MSKKLEKIFGLRPVEVSQPIDNTEHRSLVNQEQIDTDLSVARENIHNALEVAKSALDDMLMIARQSQHPKAYESLNAILNTYSGISSELANLQIKKQKLQPNQTEKLLGDTTTNNYLFVGSTAEIQKMIEEASAKKET